MSEANDLVVQSHRGPYRVHFDDSSFDKLNASVPADAHFIIDDRVAALHAHVLGNVLSAPSVLRIEANEPNKALDKFPAYIEHLVARGVRRGHTLVAIGGGVIQDIVCFLGAVLLRGLPWTFYPTTLLAQADSCIGSKSSINVGSIKNILGTFTPPVEIFISTRVLDTLDARDVRSGAGEMLKVHAIEGPASFDCIAADYPRLFRDPALMRQYIRRSLEIKKKIIELDEFDQGPRNVMNYGHSFGHAIESATDFAIPHGIAITMGMDMANYAAAALGQTERRHFERMHPVLAANYRGFETYPIPLASLLRAISKDKKNTGAKLGLILPDAEARIGRTQVPNDERFSAVCAEYLAKGRGA